MFPGHMHRHCFMSVYLRVELLGHSDYVCSF